MKMVKMFWRVKMVFVGKMVKIFWRVNNGEAVP